ncbi:ABC transporter permease [Mycoplasmatota bacterium]|nr:ABC transporter permease [Mycoplasmatota bacterium]
MVKTLRQYYNKVTNFYRNININDSAKNLIVISILILVFLTLKNPRFISVNSLKSMAFQIPEIGILVLAISIVMIAGGIDLSIVGIANLSSITAALFMINTVSDSTTPGMRMLIVLIAIIIAGIVGIISGILNGLLVAYMKIAPILVTLGTMSLFTGVAVVITKGTAVYNFPEEFLYIGTKTFGFITFPFVIFLILALLVGLLLSKTAFGRRIYMIGTNIKAANFAGIKTKVNILYAYMFSGFLAAMAGIMMIAKTNSAKADYGSSYVLQAILIAILGGVDPDGGEGRVSGIIMSIITVQFISTGFTMLRINDFVKGVAWGALLLFVIILKVRNHVKE